MLGVADAGIGPRGELGVGLFGIGVLGAAGIELIQVARQFRHPFVDPGVLVAVVGPVDHVLKLMRQRAVVELAVRLGVAGVSRHVEHLALV